MRSYREIFDEFMQRSKEELAALLTVDAILKENEKYRKPIESPNIVETPAFRGMICRSWDDCTNPHMDCVNCPLRFKTGGYTFNGNGTFTNTTMVNTDGQFSTLDEYQFTC